TVPTPVRRFSSALELTRKPERGLCKSEISKIRLILFGCRFEAAPFDFTATQLWQACGGPAGREDVGNARMKRAHASTHTSPGNTERNMPMQSELRAASSSTGMLWIGRILSTLPVLFLLFDGVMKLVKPTVVVETTVRLGYPESVIVPLGVILLCCTVL